jgi:hypothetical protein
VACRVGGRTARLQVSDYCDELVALAPGLFAGLGLGEHTRLPGRDFWQRVLQTGDCVSCLPACLPA